MFAAALLRGQCCLGAQNVVAESQDGRFRVEAASQTGTGPTAHGPYSYVFRSSRRAADGTWVELGSFERAWDSKAHFHMQVFVSPTGNGFLLDTSLEPDLLFFAADGKELRRIRCTSDQAVWPSRSKSPLLLCVLARGVNRRIHVWLPLAQLVGPEERRVGGAGADAVYEPVSEDPCWSARPDEVPWLQRMLHWSPDLGERQRAEAESATGKLFAATDAGELEAATDSLVTLGLSALPTLRAELRSAPHQFELVLAGIFQPVLAAIEEPLCGHAELWRDLELLPALCSHPDARLAAGARAQLARVLPRNADVTPAAVAALRDRLQWDAAAGRYERRGP